MVLAVPDTGRGMALGTGQVTAPAMGKDMDPDTGRGTVMNPDTAMDPGTVMDLDTAMDRGMDMDQDTDTGLAGMVLGWDHGADRAFGRQSPFRFLSPFLFRYRVQDRQLPLRLKPS
jgi:hypothetical protein